MAGPGLQTGICHQDISQQGHPASCWVVHLCLHPGERSYSVLLSHSTAHFPCRERKLKAYCVLPCARHVVYLAFNPHGHLRR